MFVLILLILWIVLRSGYYYPMYRRPMIFGPMFYPRPMYGPRMHRGPGHMGGHGHMGGPGHGPMGGPRF